MTKVRVARSSILVAVGVLSLLISSCASPAHQAAQQAIDRSGLPTEVINARALRTTLPIRLVNSIDVSSRPDVFSKIAELSAGRSDARLEDGTFASWTYTSGPNSSGILYPVALGAVRVGPTLASVGIQGPPPADSGPEVRIPEGAGCNLIDAERLKVPTAQFEYIAACRKDTLGALSEIILFNTDGSHSVLGSHPLRLSKLSTGPGLHGMSGNLTLLTAPDEEGRSYLQWYDWSTQPAANWRASTAPPTGAGATSARRLLVLLML